MYATLVRCPEVGEPVGLIRAAQDAMLERVGAAFDEVQLWQTARLDLIAEEAVAVLDAEAA